MALGLGCLLDELVFIRRELSEDAACAAPGGASELQFNMSG